MKRALTICIVLVAALLVAAPAMAAKDLKIGIVDTQKIFKEAKAAKSANDILQKELAAKQATLADKGKEVKRLQDEANKAAEGPDKAAKAEKLAQLVKEYKRLETDLGEAQNKKKAELTQKLIDEVRQVVKKIADKESYTLILEKRSIVTNDDGIDITDKVIKEYDAAQKK